MKIVVCYKNVPEEQQIELRDDRTLDLSAAQWKIGQYDLNAIEFGATLAEQVGDSELIALSAAGAVLNNVKQRKNVLSRGTTRLIGVQDDALDTADCYAVACVLAKAIEKIGDVDVILFGEGSGDIYAQQTGLMTGLLLGWTTLNCIQAIEKTTEGLRLTRSLEDGNEILEVTLPVALSVTSDGNRPRIPQMKDILAAGRKPVEIWSLADLGVEAVSATETISILAPEQTARKCNILEGESSENIDLLFRQLKSMV